MCMELIIYKCTCYIRLSLLHRYKWIFIMSNVAISTQICDKIYCFASCFFLVRFIFTIFYMRASWAIHDYLCVVGKVHVFMHMQYRQIYNIRIKWMWFSLKHRIVLIFILFGYRMAGVRENDRLGFFYILSVLKFSF